MRQKAFLATLLIFASAVGCSSASKRTTPRLADLEGKRVALLELEAEPNQRTTIEVALINQLQKRGTFELIPQEEVRKARENPQILAGDSQAIAQALRADYLLSARVLEFDAQTRTGYDRVTVEDSQLAEERGEKERFAQKLVKVRALEGKVRVRLRFTKAGTPPEVREADAIQEETVRADEARGAIKLPPRLSFLERLTNEAFGKFFEQYQE